MAASVTAAAATSGGVTQSSHLIRPATKSLHETDADAETRIERILMKGSPFVLASRRCSIRDSIHVRRLRRRRRRLSSLPLISSMSPKQASLGWRQFEEAGATTAVIGFVFVSGLFGCATATGSCYKLTLRLTTAAAAAISDTIATGASSKPAIVERPKVGWARASCSPNAYNMQI